MKKLFFCVTCLLLVTPFYGYGMEKDKCLEWDRLMSEGSNYLIRVDSGAVRTGRKVLEEILTDGRSKERERWFRTMVSFSMSTNDMSCYSYWLWKKSDLILITAWMQSSELSWIELAKFLADVRGKRRPMTLERRKELRKEIYPDDSKYDFAAFRKRWYQESRYQNALSHAELMTTRAFSNLLRQSTEEQKRRLTEILSDVIGEDFVSQLKEQERNKRSARGKNTVKKINGVVVE